LRRLCASALISVWLIPAIASIAAIGLLEVAWQDTKGTKVPLEPGPLLVLAIGIGMAAWLVITALRAPLAGPKHANYRSYSELMTRLIELRARAQVICRRRDEERQFVARIRNRNHDAHNISCLVNATLDGVDGMVRGYGVVWVLGRG
jgi:hypothetical protein